MIRRALALLLCLAATTAGAEVWRFGLIGDVPYSDRERHELPRMMAAMQAQGIRFLAHIGDIKNGSSRCDDALYADRHALFNASAVPFVYVPGDNEWTDCDRLSAGHYDPEERLAHLRRVFFDKAQTLGQTPLPVERQSAALPEHLRFQRGRILFVSLNLPGSNNNFGPGTAGSAEFRGRNPQVIAWLRAGFAQARALKLRGIVLLFQANPGFVHYGKGLPHTGYREFLDVLREETQAFAGQVVAVHGDTHMSRIDHPLRDTAGRPIANFTRVETFGYPVMGWTEGIVDDDAPDMIRFTPHPWGGAISGEN